MSIGAIGSTPSAYVATLDAIASDDAASEGYDDASLMQTARRRRDKYEWPPGGFNIPKPGANLPPNHPMHPDNRRGGAHAAYTAAADLGAGASSDVDEGEIQLARRRRRHGRRRYQWPGLPVPGANLPPNHPMHPNNRSGRRASS